MNTGKHRTFIKGLRIALVLIISLAVAAIFIKTRPRPRQKIVKNVVPLVEVVQVRKTSPSMIIRAYGTVRSGENLSLTAEVKGKIVEMVPDFEEGAYFPEGSFLIRIDPRNYNLTVERLHSEIARLDAELARITQEQTNHQASLKIAEEDLSLSKAEYDRDLSLSKRKVVSQNELDRTRQRWLTSRQKTQAQFLIPMAVSIAFGLMVATVLTLLFVPTLYLILAEVTTFLRRLFGLGPATIEPAGEAK